MSTGLLRGDPGFLSVGGSHVAPRPNPEIKGPPTYAPHRLPLHSGAGLPFSSLLVAVCIKTSWRAGTCVYRGRHKVDVPGEAFKGTLALGRQFWEPRSTGSRPGNLELWPAWSGCHVLSPGDVALEPCVELECVGVCLLLQPRLS